MESQSAEDPTGMIIAGSGDHEKAFSVPKSALEKSPVIKGWIEDGLPDSMRKGQALYFADCDPEIVLLVINYLISATEGLIAILDSSGEGRDALFYLRMYKFALCLGLNDLCLASMHKIKELTRNTEIFVNILSFSAADRPYLIDNPPFRDWIVGYMAAKSETLNDSTLVKNVIMQNSELAWRLCSLLMSSLGAISQGSIGAYTMPLSMSSPPPTPPSNLATPDLERRKSSPYSYRPPRSPSPANRVKKPQKDGRRNFSASVEDAIDHDYLSVKRESND